VFYDLLYYFVRELTTLSAAYLASAGYPYYSTFLPKNQARGRYKIYDLRIKKKSFWLAQNPSLERFWTHSPVKPDHLLE
jgi:hypothetical protein